MNKHTPGPWYRNIKPASKYGTIFAGDAPRHKHVAHLAVTGLSEEEIEANCALILAAPDLLRELQGFVNRWTKYPKPPTGRDLETYLLNAQAVIDKATAS